MYGDRPRRASQQHPQPHHMPRPRALDGARRKLHKTTILAVGVALRLRLLRIQTRQRSRIRHRSPRVDLAGAMICSRMFGSRWLRVGLELAGILHSLDRSLKLSTCIHRRWRMKISINVASHVVNM
jgi:hypothetical protein